jgi:hypothetical protein
MMSDKLRESIKSNAGEERKSPESAFNVQNANGS